MYQPWTWKQDTENSIEITNAQGEVMACIVTEGEIGEEEKKRATLIVNAVFRYSGK